MPRTPRPTRSTVTHSDNVVPQATLDYILEKAHAELLAELAAQRHELEQARVLLAERRVRYELSQESPNGH